MFAGVDGGLSGVKHTQTSERGHPSAPSEIWIHWMRNQKFDYRMQLTKQTIDHPQDVTCNPVNHVNQQIYQKLWKSLKLFIENTM